MPVDKGGAGRTRTRRSFTPQPSPGRRVPDVPTPESRSLSDLLTRKNPYRPRRSEQEASVRELLRQGRQARSTSAPVGEAVFKGLGVANEFLNPLAPSNIAFARQAKRVVMGQDPGRQSLRDAMEAGLGVTALAAFPAPYSSRRNLRAIEGGKRENGPVFGLPRLQSRSYYQSQLKGSDPEVILAIPENPQIEDLFAAKRMAIQKRDQRAAKIITDEVNHLRSISGGQDFQNFSAFETLIRNLRGVRNLRETRKVRLGEHEQQFPNSPALVTAFGQRMIDRFSERLSGKVTPLRESKSSLARGTGRVLTPMSARARVPKQAGKHRKDERVRSVAGRAIELRELKSVGGRLPLFKQEGAEAAHWWYAQMPKAYRNPEGLKLAHGKLSEQRDYYASGQASRELEGEIAKLREEIKAAPDDAVRWDLIGQVRALKDEVADIPDRIKDISEDLNKLDEIIAKPVDVDEYAIEAIRVLMQDRKEAMIEAKKLNPDRASNREGLVSSWLGLEPSGEEIFVGHRLGKTAGGSGLPSGASLGRTRIPAGLSHANELRLISTGRARKDMDSIIEDWQASQVYGFHNSAKQELGDMGRPFEGRLGPKDLVVNPKGKVIPRHQKVDDAAQAKAEGFDEDVLLDDARDYVRSYIGANVTDPDTGENLAEKIIREATENGQLEDLRVVPVDVAERYFGQFITPKIRANIPGLPARGRLFGKGADYVNDLVYTSLIYSNPGYIPANSLANLLMAGAQQGAFLPINLIRAGQLMTHAPQRLRDKAKAEIGMTSTDAAFSGTNPLKGIGKVVSGIADTPYRLSALIHEAARVGIISKTKPHLSGEDYQKLEHFLTDPAYREILNDVRDRAVQAMVDFERLGPMERALARRLLFIWRWMRGGTRYPFRFALDHPIRSGLMAYVVAGAPGAPEGVQEEIQDKLPNVAEGMPPWLEGAFEAGQATVDGVEYPRVFPNRQISPVSTPWGVAGTVFGRPGSQTIGELLNPAIPALWHTSHQQSPFGRDVGSYGEAAKQNIERLAPGYGLTRDLISPPEGGLYPEDRTRTGRLKRAARVFPIAIDPDEAREARVREGMVPAIEMRQEELFSDSQKAGMGEPPPQVVEDLKWKVKIDQEINKDAEEGGEIDYVKAVKIAARIYDERYHAGVVKATENIRTVGEAKKMYEQLRSGLYPSFRQWDRVMDRILDQNMESEPVGD